VKTFDRCGELCRSEAEYPKECQNLCVLHVDCEEWTYDSSDDECFLRQGAFLETDPSGRFFAGTKECAFLNASTVRKNILSYGLVQEHSGNILRVCMFDEELSQSSKYNDPFDNFGIVMCNWLVAVPADVLESRYQIAPS